MGLPGISCFWSFGGALRPWGPCLSPSSCQPPHLVHLSAEPRPQFPKPPSCLTLCLADWSFGCVRTGRQTPCTGGEPFCDPSSVVQSSSPVAQRQACCLLSVMGLSILSVSPDSGLTPSYLSQSPPWQLPPQARVSSRGSDAGRLEWTPKAKVLQPLGACLPPPGLSLQPGGCRAGGRAGLSTAPRGSSWCDPPPPPSSPRPVWASHSGKAADHPLPPVRPSSRCSGLTWTSWPSLLALVAKAWSRWMERRSPPFWPLPTAGWRC